MNVNHRFNTTYDHDTLASGLVCNGLILPQVPAGHGIHEQVDAIQKRIQNAVNALVSAGESGRCLTSEQSRVVCGQFSHLPASWSAPM